MNPLDRQLDRASRDVPVAAHVMGPAGPPAHVSGHQAAPATHDTSTPTGAALFGCTCGHSRHAHQAYARCQVPGCTCWTYRSANQSQTKNSARTGGSRSGA